MRKQPIPTTQLFHSSIIKQVGQAEYQYSPSS